MALSTSGRIAEALTVVSDGDRAAASCGDHAQVRLWTVVRARALLDAGRLVEAGQQARSFLELVDEDGAGDSAEVTALHVLGSIAVRGGDDVTRTDAEHSVRRMRASTSTLVRGAGAWLCVLLGEGAVDGPVGVAEIDVRGPWSGGPVDPADGPAVVTAALRAGQLSVAQQAVDAAVARMRSDPDDAVAVAARCHATGLLHRDAGSVLRAAQVLGAVARPLARAAAFEDHARLVVEQDSGSAVRSLEEALRLCAVAGAEQDAARVRATLRRLGVHRRRGVPVRAGWGWGWDALTPTELAVVRLVVRGATNRQVAERLHLSPHTVNTHLRHTFAKLDVSSRVELTRLVCDRRPVDAG